MPSNQTPETSLPSGGQVKLCDLKKVALETSAIDYWSHSLRIRLDSLSDFSATASAGDLNVLKAFDDEVVYLRTAICAIHARRNRTIPTCRLSPEILDNIFSFLVVVDLPWKQNLGWIKVSHVCSYWRDVALENTNLWTKINLDLGREWVSEMSTRAKRASLFFKSSCMESSVQLITPHLPRARVIILSGLVDPFQNLQPIDAPAPIVEHVELSVRTEDNCITELPENLFANHAPLAYCLFFWVYGNSAKNSSMPPYDNFFDALSEMCYLETLLIYDALPPLSASTSGQPRKTIALSHLSNLTLGGVWPCCMAFLEIVEFPPLAELFLSCDCEEEELSTRFLLPVLEKQGGKTGLAPPLRTIQMNRPPSSGYIFFHGWRHCDPRRSSEGSTMPVTLRLYNSCPQWRLECDILGALFTQETVNLFIDADPLWDLAMFRSAVGRAQSLKRISLSKSILRPFCIAMKKDTDTTAPEQTPAESYSEHIPFPSLKVIHLHPLRVSNVSKLDRTLGFLTRVLRKRSTLRAPIRQIDIIQPDLPEKWMEELRAVVPNVTWRGGRTADRFKFKSESFDTISQRDTKYQSVGAENRDVT